MDASSVVIYFLRVLQLFEVERISNDFKAYKEHKTNGRAYQIIDDDSANEQGTMHSVPFCHFITAKRIRSHKDWGNNIVTVCGRPLIATREHDRRSQSTVVLNNIADSS